MRKVKAQILRILGLTFSLGSTGSASYNLLRGILLIGGTSSTDLRHHELNLVVYEAVIMDAIVRKQEDILS